MRAHGAFRVRPKNDEDRPIRKETVRRVVATFRPYRRKVSIVALAIITTSILGVVNPLLIKQIFDKALFGNPQAPVSARCSGGPCPDLPLLYRYVALMIAIPVVSGTIGIG